MGEILPDGTLQGYYTICQACGEKDVPCNAQGQIYHHNCLYCGAIAPKNVSQKEIVCNREKGHPGKHCRFVDNPVAKYGDHNIWW